LLPAKPKRRPSSPTFRVQKSLARHLFISLSLSLTRFSPLEHGRPVAAELNRLALRRLEAGAIGGEPACHG